MYCVGHIVLVTEIMARLHM